MMPSYSQGGRRHTSGVSEVVVEAVCAREVPPSRRRESGAVTWRRSHVEGFTGGPLGVGDAELECAGSRQQLAIRCRGALGFDSGTKLSYQTTNDGLKPD
eukprot:529269-Hanusia_phi.AAC.1